MTTDRFSQLDHYLDALVGRQSTPSGQSAPDPATLDAIVAASQLHDLAKRAEGLAPYHSLPPTWEDFMTTHAITPAVTAAPSSRPIRNRLSPKASAAPSITASTRPGYWNVAANAVLVIMLLLLSGAGAWRVTDGFQFGSGDGGPGRSGIPFGAFTGEGTPDGLDVDGSDLPTADDCTIEPLTVDEVIWYIQAPFEAFLSTSPTTAVDPGDTITELEDLEELAAATPSAASSRASVASQSDLDAMNTAQYMWMACAIAKSPFQYWATMDPRVVASEILGGFLPPLTGENEARRMLEALQEDPDYQPDPQRGVFLGTTCAAIALASDHPDHTWGGPDQTWSGQVSNASRYLVDWSGFDAEGNPLRQASPPVQSWIDEQSAGFVFVWNEARQSWLIEQYPNCG